MPRVIKQHKLILNNDGGIENSQAPYDVEYNLNDFLSQFPRTAVAGAKYRVGVDFLHFSNNINVDTLNVRLNGFVQNKNRTYFGTARINSDIIATFGKHEGTQSFNVNPNPPKMIEGYFSSSSNVKVNFLNDLGTAIQWNATGNETFQLNLLVEIEYDE